VPAVLQQPSEQPDELGAISGRHRGEQLLLNAVLVMSVEVV
jgi:hypothetical protein